MLVPKITGKMLRAGRVFADLTQKQLANAPGLIAIACAIGKAHRAPRPGRNIALSAGSSPS
jgi:hypothetical protein